MEVSDAIWLAREKSEAMARLARILARLKPLIYSTGTTVELSDDDVKFYCMSEADAKRLADAIPGKLELAYRGAGTILYGTVHVQGVDFHFSVPTIRKIRLEQCELKKGKMRAGGMFDVFEAKLLFCDLELAKNIFKKKEFTNAQLKERLWNLAILQKKNKHRLEKFDFAI